MLLLKQAYTDEPYKNMFKIGEFPSTAAAPIIKIPVPKKNEEIIEVVDIVCAEVVERKNIYSYFSYFLNEIVREKLIN